MKTMALVVLMVLVIGFTINQTNAQSNLGPWESALTAGSSHSNTQAVTASPARAEISPIYILIGIGVFTGLLYVGMKLAMAMGEMAAE